MLKDRFSLTSTKDKINTGLDERRNGSGELTSLMVKLLPETRELIYQYQDQFAETHGWALSASLAINELILMAGQLRKMQGQTLMPGYCPGLYKEGWPIKKGQTVLLDGKPVEFVEYLPGNKCRVLADQEVVSLDRISLP